MMTLPDRQSLHTSPLTASSTTLAYGILFLLFIYYLLQYLDFPILPISELLWNALVCITPIRLITFLYPSSNLTIPKQESDDKASRSVGYARKSEAMRHILGFDGTGVVSNVQRARSVSGIKSMMRGTPRSAPPGLGNWDNSCYQNSILQGLAALRSLPSYLAQGSKSEAPDSTKATLRDLVEKLNDPTNAGGMFWTPAELKSMSSWQQQDAQEYFSKMLDEVDKELSRSAEAAPRNVGLAALADRDTTPHELRPRIPLDTTTISESPTSMEQSHELPDELTSIIARNPLEGLLAQRVGCLRCGYVEGLSLIPFNCLTVPLGSQWMYDIRSCLDEYTNLEPIHEVECTKCTLLHTKKQLERLISQLQVQDPQDKTSSTSEMLIALMDSSKERLATVNTALEDEDFSDNTLKKCQITAKGRVSTTKTRQAVVARAPKSLAIHVNRSVFDEFTGAQTKNYADVRFPHRLDFNPWCLGEGQPSTPGGQKIERWNIDPATSMLPLEIEEAPSHLQKVYELRAVVTHYGRHENGHYICYRKYSVSIDSEPASKEGHAERWWRLSDDEVSQVTEDHVLSQGGVFMLFYEQVEQPQVSAKTKECHASVQNRNATNINQVIEEYTLETPLPAEQVKADTPAEYMESETAEAQLAANSTDPLAVHQHTAAESPGKSSEALPETVPASTNPEASAIEPKTSSSAEQISTNATSLPLTEPNHSLKANIDDTKPTIISAVISSEPSPPILEATSSPLSREQVSKDDRKATPTMQAVQPRSGRGSASRGSKGMGQVSSMVTAN